jgi:hypothetical protein
MDEEVKIVNKKSNTWFYICVVYLVLTYGNLFDMAFNGIKHQHQYIGTELFINGLIYWYVWKKNDWKPIYGAVIGVVVFTVLLIIAMAITERFSQ